ncbi:hypothetical protein Cgig2_008981 [Carnegiea gigantea]|uniref:Uncharacterized protein n=1 Tax=Carnegiea gigantea TaxID=171969 RepID=A0A9Q1QE74_9CARY|nr:hypothetical protein Cgig2_008981 [Carnegiea gigantea]
MRCKKHLSDHSSSIGVCASCLRDRLFSLIHSQSQSHSQTHPISDPNYPDSDRNPNPKLNPNNPPPLVFPRSVSPYISRRKSEPIPRFYSTPQVNPRTKKPKFGLISKLFRYRSGKPDNPDPTTSTSSSSSYIYYSNRGLSPEHRCEEKELFEPSPARGFHRRPSPGRVLPSPARSGLAFCLSPLVRASPARNWADAGYSGEIRVPSTGSHCIKPHLSAAASFCANRSRKMADFGSLIDIN